MSRRITFVRHAMPVADEAISSRLWPLSDEGRRASKDLADRLRLPVEAYVVSSDEVKAKETAKAFSDRVSLDARLREVARPWTDGGYKRIARSWLRGQTVEGWESREDVLQRMGKAVEKAVRQGDGPICVVTHGMAMSAYVAAIDPVPFWSGLGFSDAKVLDLDARRILEAETK